MKMVVIADDSSTARMFTRRCLQIAGLADAEFMEAANGAEALELIRKNQPDLLVTDLTMPVMDGTELLMRITASPRLYGLPVLVVTSAANKAKEEYLKQLGAFAVLSKPISPAAVSEALEPLLTWGDNR